MSLDPPAVQDLMEIADLPVLLVPKEGRVTQARPDTPAVTVSTESRAPPGLTAATEPKAS